MDHADHGAPTRQRDLGHAHNIDQGSICSERQIINMGLICRSCKHFQVCVFSGAYTSTRYTPEYDICNQVKYPGILGCVERVYPTHPCNASPLKLQRD